MNLPGNFPRFLKNHKKTMSEKGSLPLKKCPLMLELKSTYTHVEIKTVDRYNTVLEASDSLCNFQRIQFGVFNGVSSFNLYLTIL